MIRTIFCASVLAFAIAPVTSVAQSNSEPLGPEDRMLLRCSAAFALVAHGQETGTAEALAFPPLAEDGRDYFVRASAKVMDDAGLDRDAISAALAAEAQDMVDNDTVTDVARACLPMLSTQ